MVWYGAIGIANEEETSPSVYTSVIEERMYYGEVYHLSASRQQGSGVNDDLRLTQEVSIIADPYLTAHYGQLVYLALDGVKWKIVSVRVDRPRLRLSLGGVWNEESRGVRCEAQGDTFGS